MIHGCRATLRGCPNPMLANTMQEPPGSRHTTRPGPRKHRVYVPKAAQASPLYTHARLSGLCPGTLCPTGAARRPRHGPQEPPGAAPISFQDPGRGFPVRSAGGLSQGRSDAHGAARCHAWPRLAADLRRSCRAGSPDAAAAGPPRRRTVRRVFVYVHIYGRLKTWL